MTFSEDYDDVRFNIVLDAMLILAGLPRSQHLNNNYKVWSKYPKHAFSIPNVSDTFMLYLHIR